MRHERHFPMPRPRRQRWIMRQPDWVAGVLRIAVLLFLLAFWLFVLWVII